MPDIAMKPGRCKRVEFEYRRHGTQTLIATLNVATGRIDQATVGDTRTEQDLEVHLTHLLAQVVSAPKIHTRYGLFEHPLLRSLSAACR